MSTETSCPLVLPVWQLVLCLFCHSASSAASYSPAVPVALRLALLFVCYGFTAEAACLGAPCPDPGPEVIKVNDPSIVYTKWSKWPTSVVLVSGSSLPRVIGASIFLGLSMAKGVLAFTDHRGMKIQGGGFTVKALKAKWALRPSSEHILPQFAPIYPSMP